MSDTNKVNNWSYPFKTAGENSKEVTDPQLYFDALAKAENGYYPLGANGLWHGGVHFDSGTGALLNQSEIRCIADGEVIAYRIDQQYPMTPYGAVNQPGSGPAPVGAKYSTGFVLVKHRLILPPAPAPAATTPAEGNATAAAPASSAPTPTSPPAAQAPATGDSAETAPAAPAEGESLTFYSLYMHLLDWTGYQAQTSLKRPAFWGGGTCKVKNDAPDKVLGLNVREYHIVSRDDVNRPKYENVLATLPRGTEFEVTGDPKSGWYKLVRTTPPVEGLAENTGWVYVAESKSLGGERYLVAEHLSKDEPAGAAQYGLHVRKGGAGSDVLAVLPRGTEITVNETEASGKYLKLVSIASGSSIPALTADAEGKLPGYVWKDSLDRQQEPDTRGRDAVHVLSTPYKIKAGELIGHLGLYQDFNQTAASPRLHLEVFSCDDVPAFIAKSQTRAATLPEAQKTLIKVHKGSAIIQPMAADAQVASGCDVRLCADSPKDGCWAKVQKYVICNAERSTELGAISGGAYPLTAAQRATLASRMGVEATDMPDKVDFLKVYFTTLEGGDPQNYTSGSIPSTHPWRKVGAAVGDPIWVERSKLDAQGKRTSTDGALSAWKQFPLQSSSDGAKSGYDRILPTGSWDGLPHERKAIDHDKVLWWHVTVGDEAGKDISGWVPEKDLIVTRHSPWEWPGFSTIQEAATPADLHARTLQAEGRITSEEATQLQGRVDAAERGPILQKLYEIIDLPGNDGARDGLLTTEEFKAALGKPWLAQQLSLLIAQYESEWFPNEAKWKDLDAHMADDLANWEKEKERIKNLSWWEHVYPSADGMAWHLNLIGIIGNFVGRERRRRDYDLGSLSSIYETGGRGSRTVSGGAGDSGGVSYGAYQMTSQVTLQDGSVINGGTVKKFINWSKFPWTAEFDGLTPGTAAFSQKWKDLVDEHPEEFKEVEHEFIKVTHFDIQIQKVINDTGIDLRYHSHTINDVVWSTAVQQGPGASIIANSINSLGMAHEESKSYDSALIGAIYNERGRRIVGGDKDGQLFYFSRNSIAVQEGVAARFVSEKAKAQELLENETDY